MIFSNFISVNSNFFVDKTEEHSLGNACTIETPPNLVFEYHSLAQSDLGNASAAVTEVIIWNRNVHINSELTGMEETADHGTPISRAQSGKVSHSAA